MCSVIKADKKFILSNKEGFIERVTKEYSNGFSFSIYFLVNDLKYSVSPKTFSAIVSHLEKVSMKKNNVEIEKDSVPTLIEGDIISVIYKIK